MNRHLFFIALTLLVTGFLATACGPKTVYLVQQPDGSFEEQPVFREVSILPIIPSISYQFKF